MSFPGMPPIGGAGGGNPATAGMTEQEQRMVKMMNAAAESCPFKIALAGGGGFVLGGAFGLFTAAMAYDTPLTAKGQEITSLPMREQLRQGFRDMGSRSWSAARNFGYVGAVYSAAECAIEGLRAKNDIKNHVAAGCVTGGWLARNAGPQAAAAGCVGFAAFSTAIEMYMRMPSDD
ncbi:putative mitochondrial import inner membrane translocase subunit [Talaromyces proteolyticus]|uniref:Mitochondrial import inner membrane translocase subunit TIM22 n=1 Tax=Talaromyces proteolyticus TaxID=1131652 RepID=A0AAD4L0S6_9EURO|nr:putative mitochondrial import inner membrane translocase subunit [Talaromyces proteolyticus]KAH8702026.1 putative mitochondrial import inner membrane translocase subunit [Talaromyces proteolyticus]